MIAFPRGPVTIEIAEGDITRQAVDAIVNAANNHLWMGGGVAGAIKARGGVEIEREAIGQGPVQPGEAVVTGAGTLLPVKHVIHAAVMGQDLQTSPALVARATASALDAARRLGLTSVAFPALGTGVGGFPMDECARIMIGQINAHARTPTSLRRVALVLFGEPACRAFERVAREVLGED